MKPMVLKTKVFELSNGRYKNLSGLAQAMGISVSQIYRVREGKRGINQKFFVGRVWTVPELFFEKKQLIPALQLLVSRLRPAI